jgi:hypothetical protein
MSYEELLALGEKVGKVEKGFKQYEIDLLPTKRFENKIDD